MERGHVSLHWFRKNLRLHDNPALLKSIAGSQSFYGVYVLPFYQQEAATSPNRWVFLTQCLKDLDESLRRCGSQLIVARGYPAQVFPRLWANLGITRVTFEMDSEPYGRQRDAVVTNLARQLGIEVVAETSHTLYNIEDIIKASDGKTPVLFEDFTKVLCHLGAPARPVETVDQNMFGSCVMNAIDNFTVPELADLGIQESSVTSATIWKGGETAALQRLRLLVDQVMCDYFDCTTSIAKLPRINERLPNSGSMKCLICVGLPVYIIEKLNFVLCNCKEVLNR